MQCLYIYVQLRVPVLMYYSISISSDVSRFKGLLCSVLASGRRLTHFTHTFKWDKLRISR